MEDDSFPAIVNCAGNLGFQLVTCHNPINVAVFQQKFAGLESFWQFDANGRFDRSGTGKANESLWFCEYKIAKSRNTCRNSAHRRIGQN